MITWQNIGQASFGEANALFNQAAQQTQAGIQGLKGIADGLQQKRTMAKTNQVLAQINSTKDEFELDALKNSIDLNDPEIDSNAVVAALNERPKTLLDMTRVRTDIDAAKTSMANDTIRTQNDTAAVKQNVLESQANIKDKARQTDLEALRTTAEVASTNASTAATLFQTQQAKYAFTEAKNDKELNQKLDRYVGENANMYANVAIQDPAQGDVYIEKVKADLRKQNVPEAKIAATVAKFNEQLIANSDASPAAKLQGKEIQKTFSEYIAKRSEELALEKKAFEEKYGKRPEIPRVEGLAVEQGNTPAQVLDKWANTLPKSEVTDQFISQGKIGEYFGIAGGNLGLRGLKEQLTNPDSDLMKQLKKPSTKDQTAVENVDPDLLSAALATVQTEANILQDGVDADKLVDVIRTLAAKRGKAAEYDVRYKASEAGVIELDIKAKEEAAKQSLKSVLQNSSENILRKADAQTAVNFPQ